ARGRHRHRLGIAPAAWHLDRRWLVAEPVSDAVHDARHLPGLLVAAATVPAPHGPRSRPPHRRMNPFSAPILRPVATTLLSLGITLLGIVAYLHMPIAALPSVDRPTIGVWAGLPGASADTISTSLAQPLERQVGIIPGIMEMGSFSATGGTQITVQFELGRDIDAANAAVQAAINTANPNLPKDLPQPPVHWKANPSGWAVIAIALTSDVVEPKVMYDYADSVIAQKLSQLPGVAKVNVAGAERPAVRIRVSPRLLASMNLSLEQVRQAA